MEKKSSWAIIILMAVFTANSSLLANNDSELIQNITAEQRERSLGVLHEVLKNEDGWVKIKAADYLLSLDYVNGVKEVFEKKLDEIECEPEYKAGIWMILAKSSYLIDERNAWIEKIRSVLEDPDSDYISYAVEALNNLDYQFTEEELSRYYNIITQDPEVKLNEKTRELINLSNTGTKEDV